MKNILESVSSIDFSSIELFILKVTLLVLLLIAVWKLIKVELRH
jgi:hypothetical protein